MSATNTLEEIKANHINAMGVYLVPVYYALWTEIAALHMRWKEYVTIYGTKQARLDWVNEIKATHINAMGVDLGPVYYALWTEIAALHMRWKEYVTIYGTKQARLDLVNKAARHFFFVVQGPLWESTLLHLARLTDPEKSAGNFNLTIHAFPDLIKDSEIKNKVFELNKVAIEKTKFCRGWRNRRLAHKDRDLAIHKKAKPLEPASRSHVKEALSALTAVMNEISGHYMNSETLHGHMGGQGDAMSLLYVIDDGLKSREEKMERRKKGEYWENEYHGRDI